jgi:hypothetical protein
MKRSVREMFNVNEYDKEVAVLISTTMASPPYMKAFIDNYYLCLAIYLGKPPVS